MKRCGQCKQEKSRSREHFAFNSSASDGFAHWCRPCMNEYARARRQNPEYAARKNARERERNKRPEVKLLRFRQQIRSKYGLEPAEYDALVEQQGGRCSICGGGEGQQLQVDHCHETGAIRGLLCPPCNKVLGLARDNDDTLARAAAYIRRHRTIEHVRFVPTRNAG